MQPFWGDPRENPGEAAVGRQGRKGEKWLLEQGRNCKQKVKMIKKP